MTVAVRAMSHRLTVPFQRGGDTVRLTLEATGNATRARVQAYDFADHRARFGRLPEPRYVLTALADVPVETVVRITFTEHDGGTELNAPAIVVPAGSLAGTSFAVDTLGAASPHLRLLSLRTNPAPESGAVTELWQLDALLGNLAKLIWVIGWEKDHLRRQAARIQAQRRLRDAEGASLDRLGGDLAVPRFPPLPYGFDPTTRTVALYHLDDTPPAGQPEVKSVTDAMLLYGGVGHPGENVELRARSQATGRFGRASAGRGADGQAPRPLAFDMRNPAAQIQIADHPDFAIEAGDSFTVECFFKPAGGCGAVISKHADPGNPALAGWALSVGAYDRGIPDNPRFLLSDGSRMVTLFADRQLTLDRFYHLAGTVDLAAGEARLYVDGFLRRSASLTEPGPALGALTNAEPIRIGQTAGTPDLTCQPGGGGNACPGIIDEVRLSRAALRVFSPVLGEDDASYRQRLGLFERWTLPTPGKLQALLNDSVGTIGGMADPLVVDDVDATLLSGSHAVTIALQRLEAGETIDSVGNRRVREADVCGVAADDGEFDPDFLVTRENNAHVTFAPPPERVLARGELSPAPNKMQLVVAQRLDALLDLMPGGAVPLRVEGGFDPRADDLRAVGRGLLLRHDGIGPERLAALAHNAGFAFVRCLPEAAGVAVSMPVGNQLAIAVIGGSSPGVDGVDLRVGETLTLQVRPDLPLGTRYRWRTVACGQGRAMLRAHAGSEPQSTLTTVEPRAIVEATAPGALVVIVEATRQRRTAVGAGAYRVGLVELADGETIADDGTRNAELDHADGERVPFHPVYLITREDDRADYGSAADDRRMQPAVSRRLDDLLDLIDATGAGGRMTVVSAYDPTATDLAGTGQTLTLRRGVLSPGRLGALAHAAGFSGVRREGNLIQVLCRTEELVTVSGVDQLAEGETIALAAAPRAVPRAIAAGAKTIFTINHGTDSVSEIERASGRILGVFKVGRGPVAAAVSPASNRLYTADATGQTVTAVDLTSGAVAATIALPGVPVALAHHPSDPRLFVACVSPASLVRIDTDASAVLDDLALSGDPAALAIRPDGAAVWVAVGSTIEIVDSAAMTLLGTIALAAPAAGIAMRPDGVSAAVTMPAIQTLALIGVPSQTVHASAPVGHEPGPVTFTPDGAAICVVDRAAGFETLFIRDAADGSPRASVRLRRGPAGVVTVAEQVYVANAGSDDLSVVTVAADHAKLVGSWALGSGLGEELTWVVRPAGAARAQLTSTTTPDVQLVAQAAGQATVRVVYVQPGHVAPYTFDVRLRPELESTDAVIRKDQYDLIMNVLNAFHPVGVEVATRAIRERVIEVREELLEAFPDYTYPRFRVRSVTPPVRRKE